MDRITTGLLEEFSKEHGIEKLDEPKRFEHFVSYITIRREFSASFDTADIVVGDGNDTGIDAIACIVNGSLITDVDSLTDFAANAEVLEVTFFFVQADRGGSFEASKIGTFGYGVNDFFKQTPTLPRNASIIEAAKIMSAVYERSGKFKRGNPSCRLFYVTTGKWTAEAVPEARRVNNISDLKDTGLFRMVEFNCIGADIIQKYYNQTKNGISREFTFSSRVDAPEVPGVKEAYIGFIPVSQFLPIIKNDDGEIIRTIFYDNVRDWQDYNDVNNEIRDTLRSDHKSRFVLMNNGITIIARGFHKTASKFHIEDFQIVNGCQTSHVLFFESASLDDSVQIPLRLIHTQDESVIDSIIKSTNRQTEVKPEQFAAITDFAKKLEMFFDSFALSNRLYYERRPGQYDRLSVEKTRIVTQPNMVRAFAAMFLEEPHRTLRSYKSLTDRLGKDIYGAEHRLEPYYIAAFALYKLEYMFRSGKLDAKYRAARFHIILAARYILDKSPFGQMNSRDTERRGKALVDSISDSENIEATLASATIVIDKISSGNLDRDNIHTQTFTENLIKFLRQEKS